MARKGTLRIIAGSAGGLRLACPKGVKIRPTADRVRESVFNILGGRVAGARGLDLFAGTGAFGIEALSRGARECVFVERYGVVAAAIRRNLAATGLADRATVIVADAFSFHRKLQIDEPFGIIFLDPPYRSSIACLRGGRIAELVRRLAEPTILAPGGTIIFEHSSRARLPDAFDGAALTDRRSYGTTAVSFYSPA
jgi:16S rRNA (guanine966-N2)-methyltransferase